ncbi:MAG: penicillin-binding protein 1C, partial [Bacteroidota bacterium]
LEMYLSYLPYGGNVEGVKAASHLYFGRPPSKLSLAQSTLLTVIPNRPNSLRLDTRKHHARAARDRWLHRFEADQTFSSPQIQAALSEPIEAHRRQLVPKAPHLSQRLVHRTPTGRQTATLSPTLQARCERLLSNYVHRNRFKGISNGALIVIDNQTSAVKAYVGSADFHDVAAAGQVDGVRAIRSPGSALKPVAYAMAFDQGIYTPASRLLDVPTDWEGYSPTNYDEQYRGPVSLAYALRHSLNITAVHTLERVGYARFLDLMADAGFETIRRQRDELGLSVILGGCGVTLEELTRLFTAFARGGVLYPLAYTEADLAAPRKGVRLFSEGAAWLIGHILSGIERPDLPNDVIPSTGRSKIAWKTGTSYGHRDAWSVGFTPRYTVGVWMGNFDGRGAPELSGTGMAVPLLFEVFGALEAGAEGDAVTEFAQPHSVRQRPVCLETGDLPSEECTHVGMSYFLADISPRSVCTQAQSIYISTDSSLQYCTGCLPESGYLKASYPIYPPALTLWYESNDLPYPHPPPHNPACEATFDGPGPDINSPSEDFEYLVEAGSGQEILLQAASDTRVNRHYWYVNDRFVQSCAPGEKVFFPARPGRLKVSCMDDKGRSAMVEILVKTY